MSRSKPLQDPAPTPFTGLWAGMQLLPHFGTLCVLMWSVFSLVASAFVALALPWIGIQEEPGFLGRLWIKVALFAVAAPVSGWAFFRLMRSFPVRLTRPPLRPSESDARIPLFLALVVFGPALAMNLSAYPWTAPDELHHLTVARNLAESEQYASGHPDDELLEFDPYDSVGPTVIVPVALAFRTFGIELWAARAVMAGMFAAWLIASWLLMRPVFGAVPASLGILLAGTAVGSIYLGRTLYGEVPALMYGTAGLLYWRLGLGRKPDVPWLFLAGVCLGFAVLAKTFFVLAVFPIGAAWLFDRCSFRRLALRHMFVPGVGLTLVLGTWTLVRAASDSPGTGLQGTIAMYRHSLLFGLGSLDTLADWSLSNWMPLAATLLGVLAAIPLLTLVRYDPAALVLALIAALFAFWFVFFTPGRIPRYAWYSLAIGALLTGPLLSQALSTACTRGAAGQTRLAAAVLAAFVVIPFGCEHIRVTTLAWQGEQMRDEYALRAYVERRPADEPLHTTSWMVQRSANFFCGRFIPLIEPSAVGATDGAVIRDAFLEGDWPAGTPTIGEGRYAIVPGQKVEEPTRP